MVFHGCKTSLYTIAGIFPHRSTRKKQYLPKSPNPPCLNPAPRSGIQPQRLMPEFGFHINISEYGTVAAYLIAE